MKAVLIAILVGIVFLGSSTLFAQEIKLAIVGAQAGTKSHRIGIALMNDIAERIGRPVELLLVPAKRASIMLRDGRIHGDVSRVAGFQKQIPGLIRIQESILNLPLFVYMKSADFKVDGWESLKPYSVVYVRGYQLVEDHLKPIHDRLYPVNTEEQAFLFVAAGRADILISHQLFARSIKKRYKEELRDIKALRPPVAVLKTYTFFLKEHADLAQKYEKALIDMKKDGTYLNILTQTK